MEFRRDEIVTIDGPAGAGKSSVSRQLARRLGFTYMDTGAMYRAVALAALEAGLRLDDAEAIGAMLDDINLELKGDKVYLRGEDVSSAIRTPEMDQAASAVSRLPVVREFLGRLQKDMGSAGGVVAEGRDMGSVVFPGARYKFFLTASPEERARRRQRQLREKGQDVDVNYLLRQIINRDEADSTREVAPLMVPPNSIIIDSTNLGVENVLEEMIKYIKNL